ncbi:MAG: GatB/YqeY domain-containing protein, partial [Clostridia bacterium]|nr:GatB/YqeY domain-containing protein [Clostridia bacterium]
VMATLVKQRRESAQMYRDNGRTDLAEKEELEIAVVQQFLPQPLTDAELTALIEQTVTELGASSLKDLGAVMKVLSEATRGRAEGRVVSERVRARLGA